VSASGTIRSSLTAQLCYCVDFAWMPLSLKYFSAPG
jgi:hypothetical protein